MSEEENPLAAALAAMRAASETSAKRMDRFRTEADSVLKRVRIGVYNITDRVDGPAETLAYGAMKNFRKGSRAIVGHLMDIHPDFAEVWIEGIVATLRISQAERLRSLEENKAKEAKKP